MSRQLHLDTSNTGTNRRYSFLETPMEMQAPGHQSQPLRQMPAPDPVQDPISPPQQPTPAQPQPSTVNEKAPLQQEDGIGMVSNPAIEGHPAIYAPYADEMPQSNQPQQIRSTAPEYSEQNVNPPYSPGPLPIKTNFEDQNQPARPPIALVVPDTNPLQSPKLPHFPPPAASTTPQSHGDDVLAYHQPGQISHPNQAIKGGTWSHSLCDCSNIGTCCLGLICPCILYGKTQYRLSRKSRKEDPTNMLGYEACNGSCTAMALLCGCQWLMATIQHTRTRRAYGIEGDIASDCVRATCCTCCTLIQDETEIRKREEERARVAQATGAAMVSPYSAPMQMTYGPPR